MYDRVNFWAVSVTVILLDKESKPRKWRFAFSKNVLVI